VTVCVCSNSLNWGNWSKFNTGEAPYFENRYHLVNVIKLNQIDKASKKFQWSLVLFIVIIQVIFSVSLSQSEKIKLLPLYLWFHLKMTLTECCGKSYDRLKNVGYILQHLLLNSIWTKYYNLSLFPRYPKLSASTCLLVFYFWKGSLSRPETRVFGGIVVPENSIYFKFTVQVRPIVNDTYFDQCGGSLISPNYVITAGHCLFNNIFYLCKKFELFKIGEVQC
jgi:hypothetical protein